MQHGTSAGIVRVAPSAADPRCVFLTFDATNAFNTIPRRVVSDAVARRLPDLAVVVNSWLGQSTCPMYWRAEGGTGGAVEASTGVDQGCPLSPALFAIGIADEEDEEKAAGRGNRSLCPQLGLRFPPWRAV